MNLILFKYFWNFLLILIPCPYSLDPTSYFSHLIYYQSLPTHALPSIQFLYVLKFLSKPHCLQEASNHYSLFPSTSKQYHSSIPCNFAKITRGGVTTVIHANSYLIKTQLIICYF